MVDYGGLLMVDALDINGSLGILMAVGGMFDHEC